MSDFFSRLTRLAKSELNDLLTRLEESSRQEAKEQERRAKRGRNPGSHSRRQRPAGHSVPKEVMAAYASLEIPAGSDRERAKKAYRALLMRYHPDKHQNNPERLKTANLLTQRIKEAYERVLAWLDEPR